MKLNYEVICIEKGNDGRNRTYPEIVPCKNKRECVKRYNELKSNPAFEVVYMQANNGTEIVDID